MTHKMIVNAVDPEEVRIAVLHRGTLEDFDIETRGVEKNKGNIYKAKVIAVEPALNAAFVDYGADKQGFLTANDVDPVLCADQDEDRTFGIDELLKPKQEILVQVSKDEVGTKGAVLTTYLSLAGRYTVLMPGEARHGVSRKIDDDDARRKMHDAAAKLNIPAGIGVIVRTAGRDRTKTELQRDMKVLLTLWSNIRKKAEKSRAPALIFKEEDVVIRALRDYFTVDTDEIVLDSDEAYDRAAEYMALVMPRHRSALTRYVERRPIFHHYRIEEQLEALFSHNVALPSGGSLVIEPTEALVAIDVNSGKQKLGGQEETALQSNLEAGRELARQLRLRDLGGIIVIDFIDMMSRKHEQRVERTVREALKADKARVKVGRISPNGTLELTRQRIRSALDVSMFQPCSLCSGTGRILKPEAHAVQILRKLRDRAARGDLLAAKVKLEPRVADLLRTEKWGAIQDLEQRHRVRIDIIVAHDLPPGAEDFTFETDPNAEMTPLEEPNFGPAWRPDDDEALKDEAFDEFGEDEDEDEEQDGGQDGGQDENRSAEMDHPHRRRQRQRGRGRGAGRGDRDSGGGRGKGLSLPAFEMVDPTSLGLSSKGSEDKRESASRRRGRRGGRRRGKPRTPGRAQPQGTKPQAAAARRPAASAKPEPKAPPKKASLWRRIFGGGGDS